MGSDSWLAVGFRTGNNAGSYTLDSIQLEMENAIGSPDGFLAMIYSGQSNGKPNNNLRTLNGSTDPSIAGIYTYTPASSVTLSPNTPYFIVLTAGTTIANGAYEWLLSDADFYNPSDSWSALSGAFNLISPNGLSWSFASSSYDYPEYAITATAIPEPSPSFLFLLGSGVFIYVRTRSKKHSAQAKSHS